MTTIAYFDAPSGISGDMTLGALVDAGLPLDFLASGLRAALPALGGYHLRRAVSQHGIGGTRVSVVLDPAAPQPQRSWRAIRAMCSKAGCRAGARRALAIFGALARAEAQIHDTPSRRSTSTRSARSIRSSISRGRRSACSAGDRADLLLAAQRRSRLHPLAARDHPDPRARPPWPSSPPPVRPCARPRPTANWSPDRRGDRRGLAEFRQPPLRLSAVGYGFGRRELPWPNALRVWLGRRTRRAHRHRAGQSADDTEQDDVILLETNIDDMNPQFYAPTLDRLFAAGALDAWLTPIIMKKGRPGDPRRRPRRARAGRRPRRPPDRADDHPRRAPHPATRRKAGRSFATVTTPWGEARVKAEALARSRHRRAPEYDDCAALAAANDLPIATVHAKRCNSPPHWSKGRYRNSGAYG
jgi:uncharacterized protein (DUF111 family)